MLSIEAFKAKIFTINEDSHVLTDTIQNHSPLSIDEEEDEKRCSPDNKRRSHNLIDEEQYSMNQEVDHCINFDSSPPPLSLSCSLRLPTPSTTPSSNLDHIITLSSPM
jgi:hypothetical protein